MTLLSDLRTAVARRAAYRRTVAELRAIPERLWEDLSIYPGDEHRVAREAVYG